jgi:pimeloyl-ACP methyl ester carboxylesterase
MTVAERGWVEERLAMPGAAIRVRTAGSGPPLVILPDDIGVPGWLPFHETLAADHSLYLISHPGFDGSERPDWARNIRDLAALESHLLRELGLSHAAVVGFGFGGWLAAEMATQCGPCFSAMVLVAPFGLKPTHGEIFDQFLGRGPRYARAGFHDGELFRRTYGGEPDIDTLEHWEINREMTARVAWAPYLFNPALPHLLPLVQMPTLIAWGREDAIIPATESARWARLIPGARHEVIETCGHRADIEQPAALAASIERFLETTR